MADIYQAEITKMLHRYDIFTRHERALPIVKDGRVICWNTPERFTPDLTGGLVHQIHVEVKTGKSERFNFDSWSDGQREYAKEWRERRGCEYWLAIVIQTDHSPRRVKRDAFLLPYPIMIETEALLANIQGSIPYSVRPGIRKQVRDKELVASRLWARFALEYETGCKWKLPSYSPFRQMYLDQEPYLYKGNLQGLIK